MKRVGAVLLASGLGRRFGSNKLLRLVEGVPLYRRQQLVRAEPPAQTGGQQHRADFHRQNWEGPRDT